MKHYIIKWNYQDNSNDGIIPCIIDDSIVDFLKKYIFEHLDSSKVFEVQEIKEIIGKCKLEYEDIFTKEQNNE